MVTLHTIFLIVFLIAGSIIIWKIAYKNGYSHGYYDGAFAEGSKLRKKYDLPPFTFDDDFTSYI